MSANFLSHVKSLLVGIASRTLVIGLISSGVILGAVIALIVSLNCSSRAAGCGGGSGGLGLAGLPFALNLGLSLNDLLRFAMLSLPYHNGFP